MTKRILAALLALAMALSLCSFEVFAVSADMSYQYGRWGTATVNVFENKESIARYSTTVETILSKYDKAEVTLTVNKVTDSAGTSLDVSKISAEGAGSTTNHGWIDVAGSCSSKNDNGAITVTYDLTKLYADIVKKGEEATEKFNELKLTLTAPGSGFTTEETTGKLSIDYTEPTLKFIEKSTAVDLPSGKVTLDGNDNYWAEYPISTTAALADLNKALTEYAGKPGYMVVITSKESVSVGFNTTAPEGDWAQPELGTTIKFGTEAYSPSEIDKVCLNTNAKNVEISWEIIKEECKHKNLSYVVNEDGTHSAICKNCCLYIKSEYKQAHTFKDGKCSFCGTPEVEDPDKVELGVQVYVQETVVAWAGAYKGLKTGKEVEFELTNEAALAEMADIVAKPEVTKNYTQAPVFALQVSIDNCDYNTKEVDGKYPTVNFAFHYGDITIKAKGFEDVVIPGDSVDVELTAKYESWGGYSGTSTTIDLYSAVMKLKDMTLEKFCKEYLPAITSITCDLEYDSLTCHHDVKTYKSNKDKATHTVTCAFCGEVIDAAEAHDGDPCSKCDYTAAEKDSKKKTNYPGYVVQLGEEYHGFFMGGFMITMPHTFVGDECTQCGYIRPAAVEEAPAESAE